MLKNASLGFSSGAFFWRRCMSFIVAFSLWSLLSGCEKPQETPDWNETAHPKKEESPAQETRSIRKTLDSPSPSSSIRFVSYNLENFLTMPRGKEEKFKPEHETKALIANIVCTAPDVLGVCEIGTQKDLDHLQDLLLQAGLEFKHCFLAMGADPERRQALLSRYPIRPHEVPNYSYHLGGATHQIRRGILDATVMTPNGDIRFLGVHLKSKRPIPFYDQADIRREEAFILREHASKLLSDSDMKLLVFGDMNDTQGSTAIRILRGPKNKKLHAINMYDKHGTKWTHYWKREDLYSRIDYVFVSAALLPHINKNASYILDLIPNDPASDHRPLVTIIEL